MMQNSKFFMCVLFAITLLTGILENAKAEVIAVIVPKSHIVHSTEMSELSLIFWRKKLYWADGKRIQTLNYPANDPLRLQFSSSVLRSVPENQADYWNDLYFHGISPPHVVSSQEAMLRFVAETPGAIGYIDACKLDDRVKPLVWINSEGNLLSSTPEFKCPN